MRHLFIALILCGSAISVKADVVGDAQTLINDKDYTAASEILEAEIEKNPKSKQLGMLNQLLGECCYEFGDYEGARACFNIARSKGVADAYRFLGKLDYLDYDFSGASENYSKYRQMKTRAKKPVAPEADKEEGLIVTAENFLERVEKIAIIDSIAVDAAEFYKAYRLPPSAGSINGPEIIPFEDSRKEAEVAFMNEGKDFIMWAEPDSVGNVSLYESIRLTDGTWHAPMKESDILRGGGSADFPFMMPDGITLYFANDGNDSLGGYDIFVATRDAATGEYMQPQNMGMPYNSPYDDFMLAIDEQNGVGWWATDRNQLDGKLTVYVFVPNETRTNYNSDEEDVVGFAKISDFQATQDGRDYSELLETVRNIKPERSGKRADFHFPMKGGKEYTTLSDFRSNAARETMAEYLTENEAYSRSLSQLKEMRRKYADHRSDALAQKILKSESSLEQQKKRIENLKNKIYRAEKSAL